MITIANNRCPKSALEPRLPGVVRRHRAFLAAKAPGHYLVVTTIAGVQGPPVPPLRSFDLERDLHRWLDAILAAARAQWQAKEGVDDDMVPWICPRFGIAEHSAWLGMEVLLQDSTCLPVPLVHQPADLSRLRLDSDARWLRYMRDGYDYLRSRQDGTFVLGVRGTMSPMDIANAVRGDDLFLDFLTDKPFAHDLLAFVTDAIPWYYDQLLGWCDEIEGGHLMHWGHNWCPRGTIGHLSNDAAMLCGPDIYEEFGFPYEQKLISRYGRAVYHVHNQSMHFVPRLAELPGLVTLEVTHDPRTTPPVEDLDRILAVTGHANLLLHATPQQVRNALPRLGGRNVIFDVTCANAEEARRIVGEVRERSLPLH
jgi:hypothetical protein